MSHTVAAIDDVPVVPTPPEDGLEWHAVRHHLGIRAFGTNAYVGRAPGDLVIEPHDEDEAEELYVVVRGTARFTVDEDTFDAPAGTLVFVTPPSHRVAHAVDPGTTVLAVGGVPGRANEISAWETRWLRRGGLIEA
jgi:mannose-6-phosphate isomerase-like protein (cupin superfamily)